jgi:hypothetical protein
MRTEQLGLDGEAELAAWKARTRTDCAVLARMTAVGVTAMTLTDRYEQAALADLETMARYSQVIAAEYGLEARLSLRGRSLTTALRDVCEPEDERLPNGRVALFAVAFKRSLALSTGGIRATLLGALSALARG